MAAILHESDRDGQILLIITDIQLLSAKLILHFIITAHYNQPVGAILTDQ
jgi:hypothetical protein